MPLQVIPRGHRVLREALLAQTVVTSTDVGTKIRTANDPADLYPKLRLSIIDQVEERPNEADHCRVQIDVLGKGVTESNMKQCEDIAAAITSALRDCDGDWPAGKIRNCQPTITLPSSDEARARVILDVEFDVSP